MTLGDDFDARTWVRESPARDAGAEHGTPFALPAPSPPEASAPRVEVLGLPNRSQEPYWSGPGRVMESRRVREHGMMSREKVAVPRKSPMENRASRTAGPSRRARKRAAVAMILAGGKGTRLQPLTSRRCKPAVSFGGSLRVIDFALFNCLFSGIDSVHVLTQYRSETLHAHLRERWRAQFRSTGGTLNLLPAEASGPGGLYRGTADAIWQNRDLLRELDPEQVLVLSGDHVYRADYVSLLAAHRDLGADVTLLTGQVPVAEASSFGVIESDAAGRVIRFVEKPADPSPYAAAGECAINLGVYVFRTFFLLDALEEDAVAESSHDFGKDVLPASLGRGGVFSCPLRRVTPDSRPYWRDVGTVESLFEAHMDLLEEAGFRLEDPRWPPGSLFRTWLPRWYPLQGAASGSLVAASACIDGAEIRKSVIGPGARVGRGARLDECVVFPGAEIGEGAELRRVIIEEGVRVPPGARISSGAAGSGDDIVAGRDRDDGGGNGSDGRSPGRYGLRVVA